MNRKRKYMICLLLLVVAACFAACEPSEKQLKQIGEDAKEKYDTEYLPEFTDRIRTVSGFADLTVETSHPGSTGLYYLEYNNSVTCYLDYTNLHSDDIEAYYEENGGYLLKLYMSRLLPILAEGEHFSYTRDDGITVNVYVDLIGDSSCYIYTSEDKEYYYYQHDGYSWVEIDDELISFQNVNSDRSSKSSTRSGTGSSGGTRSYYGWNDPYDVDAYDDPDDFANDYEDEFDDYDDAYDYWEEEHY